MSVRLIRDGTKAKVEISGETLRIVSEVCFLIGEAWNLLSSTDPEEGELFKQAFIAAVAIPGSPVWRPRAPAEGECITVNLPQTGRGKG